LNRAPTTGFLPWRASHCHPRKTHLRRPLPEPSTRTRQRSGSTYGSFAPPSRPETGCHETARVVWQEYLANQAQHCFGICLECRGFCRFVPVKHAATRDGHGVPDDRAPCVSISIDGCIRVRGKNGAGKCSV